MHTRSAGQPEQQPPIRDANDSSHWFWQRSLQNRIILAYGLLFLLILIALLLYTAEEIYRVQIEQAEHDLEVSAFLIANALEKPLSESVHVLASFGVLDLETATEDEQKDARANVEKTQAQPIDEERR